MGELTLWTIFGVYILAMLILGEICARRKIKALDDYLLAGRKHGVLPTAGTIAATVIGAGSTIGAAGVAYYVGISAAWYLLSACVGLVLLAFTFAPALRTMRLYTVPEYIERRYGAEARTIAAGLGLIGLTMFLAAQLYAMGALTAQLMGLPLKQAIALSGLVVVLYTWRGGNWVVHWSDNVQIVWISAGLIIASAFGVKMAGGFSSLGSPPQALSFEGMGRNWFNPMTYQPVEGWNLFALGNTVIGWVIMSTTWHFAMQSTAQRVLSSRSPKVARRACLVAAAILIPLSLFVGLTGMAARVLYPGLAPPAGISQGEAFPALIKGVLHPVLAGVVLAALIAVIMSTSDSALLGASTMFVKDLYGRFFDSRATDKVLMKLSRWLTLIIGLMAIGGALVALALIRILEMVAAVYCVSLFVPILLGLYWRGANQQGAIAGMIGGALAGGIWRVSGWEKATEIHMLNVSLPLALIAMVAVSLITRSSKEKGDKRTHIPTGGPPTGASL